MTTSRSPKKRRTVSRDALLKSVASSTAVETGEASRGIEARLCRVTLHHHRTDHLAGGAGGRDEFRDRGVWQELSCQARSALPL